MREFKDKDGATWMIDLPIGAVMRVKGTSKFNLFDAATHCEALATDEAEFWELLWHLVSPQALERQLNAEQFGQLMAADCLHNARSLFFEEWTDFFRKLHRPEKAAAVEKTAQYLKRAVELATERLTSDQMQQLDSQIEARMQQELNTAFGKLLGSLDATPARSP